MKKLFIFGLAVAMLSACGNDPVTNAGYFDDDLDRSIDSSTHDDHSQNNTTITSDDHSSVVIDDHSSVNHYYTDTIFVVDTVFHETTDTIYKMTVDTLYKTHIDTLYKTLYDTLTTTIIDTVINTLVDTVVQRVIDTVINTMVDTVYTRVVDTVFNVIESSKPEPDRPRDTSITVVGTLEGYEVTRTYYGYVYKNVFYDTTLYKFTDNLELNQCGKIVQANTSETKPSYFDGWRAFDNSDTFQLGQNIGIIIPKNKEVLTKIITNYGGGFQSHAVFTADVATCNGRDVVNQVNKIDVSFLYYMCAYDLS